MNYKKQVIEAGVRMLHTGSTIGTWGNISVRDPETGLVYITPSGMPYDLLTEEDIVVMQLDGTVMEGVRKPSIETGLHLGIYRSRKDCLAIIHTHALYSTVFASIGMDIPLLLDEAAQFLGDTVHVTDYALPGTKELADECVKALGSTGQACLVRSHGAVCLGEDLEKAFLISNILEMTAHVYSIIQSMGQTFTPISEENIRAMQEFVRTKYGQK